MESKSCEEKAAVIDQVVRTLGLKDLEQQQRSAIMHFIPRWTRRFHCNSCLSFDSVDGGLGLSAAFVGEKSVRNEEFLNSQKQLVLISQSHCVKRRC